MPHPKFDCYTDKAGEFRFNLTAKNGQTILSSEGYTTKDALKNGTESVKKNAPDEARFERAEAKNGQHYFKLKAANHQVIGMSEMYNSKSAMENGIESVKNNAPNAEIEWREEA